MLSVSKLFIIVELFVDELLVTLDVATVDGLLSSAPSTFDVAQEPNRLAFSDKLVAPCNMVDLTFSPVGMNFDIKFFPFSGNMPIFDLDSPGSRSPA